MPTRTAAGEFSEGAQILRTAPACRATAVIPGAAATTGQLVTNSHPTLCGESTAGETPAVRTLVAASAALKPFDAHPDGAHPHTASDFVAQGNAACGHAAYNQCLQLGF